MITVMDARKAACKTPDFLKSAFIEEKKARYLFSIYCVPGPVPSTRNSKQNLTESLLS